MVTEKLRQGLKELHLPTIRQLFQKYADKASSESLSYEEYLQLLVQEEREDRKARRIKRRLNESRLPLCKSYENFDFKRLSLNLQRQVKTLIERNFIQHKENLLLFGNPGSGKTHLLCAVGQELIRKHDMRLLFTSSGRLLQELLSAKRDLVLPRFIKKLTGYDGLIIDDIGYVQQSKEEVEVLFALISECYERTSILLTSNLPFSQWERIFKDPMMAAAAIDRLVHHSVVLEMNIPSYRMQESKNKTKQEV